LREQCNYTGELVYWDWTLDWEHLENSPIFDPQSGFGGDGDKNSQLGTLEYFDVKFKPHCRSEDSGTTMAIWDT